MLEKATQRDMGDLFPKLSTNDADCLSFSSLGFRSSESFKHTNIFSTEESSADGLIKELLKISDYLRLLRSFTGSELSKREELSNS